MICRREEAVSTGIRAFGRDVGVFGVLVAINYLYESTVTRRPVDTDFTHFDSSEAQKDDPVVTRRVNSDLVAAVDRLSSRGIRDHGLRNRSIDFHCLVATILGGFRDECLTRHQQQEGDATEDCLRTGG